jgi:uncharacterized protein YndB with AHSA1/START domain
MIEIPSPKDRLIVCGDFEAYTPEELFDHWVIPQLVVRWWPQEARIEPRLGGRYDFVWPDMGWLLAGEYTAFERGVHLGFTWSWNHEPPEDQPLQVDLYFQALVEGATRLAIYQGPYGDSEKEREARQGNLEGWIHFGRRLRRWALGVGRWDRNLP